MANTDYDVIIIGAGISGLVCGCYLSKSGLKTLIIEKSYQPGGCCTSFSRQGYRFDACVYYLSGFRKDGGMAKICDELGLKDKVHINRNDIPDIITTPNHSVKLYCDARRTIAELQANFPEEHKAIQDLFDVIVNCSVISLTRFRNVAFKEMLDRYLKNSELKTVLSVVLLGYMGAAPAQLSFFVSALMYREFIFDGGYYPSGGMQNFSNSLLSKFADFGGKFLLSTRVKNIHVCGNSCKGVILENDEFISSNYTVAACDLRETFFELVGKDKTPNEIINRIKSMKESLSAFLIYLGMDDDFRPPAELRSHYWVIANNCDNVDKIYDNLINIKFDYLGITSSSLKVNSFLKGESPERTTLFFFVNTPFVSTDFWNQENKHLIAEKLIAMSEKVIPSIRRYIRMQIIATPLTLYKWTANYKGSAYGWIDAISQFGDPDLSEKTLIDGLFLSGHWLNRSSGVTSVANSGYSAARRIIAENTARLKNGA